MTASSPVWPGRQTDSAMPSVPSASAIRRITYSPVLSVSDANEIGFLYGSLSLMASTAAILRSLLGSAAVLGLTSASVMAISSRLALRSARSLRAGCSGFTRRAVVSRKDERSGRELGDEEGTRPARRV